VAEWPVSDGEAIQWSVRTEVRRNSGESDPTCVEGAVTTAKRIQCSE
jgi:hypothetical protein